MKPSLLWLAAKCGDGFPVLPPQKGGRGRARKKLETGNGRRRRSKRRIEGRWRRRPQIKFYILASERGRGKGEGEQEPTFFLRKVPPCTVYYFHVCEREVCTYVKKTSCCQCTFITYTCSVGECCGEQGQKNISNSQFSLPVVSPPS